MTDWPNMPNFTWHCGVGYFKVSCDQCGWESHETQDNDYASMKLRAERHSRQHELKHPEPVELMAEAALSETVITQDPPYSLDYRYVGIGNGEWNAECRHCGVTSTFITNRYAPLAELIMSGRWGWISEHYSLHREEINGGEAV